MGPMVTVRMQDIWKRKKKYERYNGQEVLDAEVGNNEFFLLYDGGHTALRFCLHAGQRVACSDSVVNDQSRRRRCVAGTQEVIGVEEGGKDVFWYDFSLFYFFLESKNGSNFDRSLAERGKGAPTFSHLD